ncbi:MAG: sugar ABC transporter permease, partial [Clostridia bacterium]|nr:sugar ABC transporter permease [Clostridia bacterium]
MILPFMVVFMLFTVIPVVTAIILSFTDFDMLSVPKFTGWDNYIRLFLDDEVFLIAVKNTLIFSVLTGPLSYFLCLIFAWLVNMFKPKVRAFLTFV